MGLGGGTGTAGNIALWVYSFLNGVEQIDVYGSVADWNSVTNKITIHGCESTGQQIALANGSATASNTDINLLISNVGVLNANADAAGATAKRGVGFQSYVSFSVRMYDSNVMRFEFLISESVAASYRYVS